MTWLLAKAFLGKASDWIAAHWQLILFSAICLYAFYEKKAYERAVKELATYKQAVTDASNKQIAELAIKKVNAQSTVDAAESTANIDMARLNLDRAKSTDDIRKLYETKLNIANNVNRRLSNTASNTNDTGEVASDTKEPATGQSECDTALADYKTLEKACTITTIDFNVCRSVIDADTLLYGREE